MADLLAPKQHQPISLPPTDWRAWLDKLFPGYVNRGFAEHHVAFWEHVWAIEPGIAPPAFLSIWARGGGKSTSAELATVAIGARGRRRYAWYVRETQDLADKSVENIASLLESSSVGLCYPELGQPQKGKFGNVRGWRRERMRTASGFTVDAIGFDTAYRGSKVEEHRPDLIILDDIDNKLDSVASTAKKITTLTTSLLPAGAPDVAVIGIQNLIIPDGLFSRLADDRADFLLNRIVSGPHPAVRGLTYEQRDGRFFITGGEATWGGQDLAICQQQIERWGVSAFLQEAQHEVDVAEGGIFSHLEYQHCEWGAVPALDRIVVWVDPAVTATDDSDCQGIQADGMARDGTIYRLFSWEGITTPQDALQRAIRKAVELKAEAVGVETDQGGDTWQSVYREAARALGIVEPPAFRSDKAGAGHGPKVHRAQQMVADYERGRIVHVIGTHTVLEKAQRRFPKVKPFDLVDAGYWSWQDLRGPIGGEGFMM